MHKAEIGSTHTRKE